MKNLKLIFFFNAILLGSVVHASSPAQNSDEQFLKSMQVDLMTEFKPFFDQLKPIDEHNWEGEHGIDSLNFRNNIFPNQEALLRSANEQLARAEELKRFKPDFINYQSQLSQAWNNDDAKRRLFQYPLNNSR